MTVKPVSPEPGVLSCELCLKEIPVSEAKMEEAVDYVVYFCGLECYQQWLTQRPEQED